VTTKPGRGFVGAVKTRFWSATMVVGIGFLLLVSLAASAWLSALGNFLGRGLPLPAGVMATGNALLSFAVITCMFATIYKLLPDVKIGWGNVWTGAAVTALLFTLGKLLIGLYLGGRAVVSVYGATGALIVILLWVYYSAQIVFFGAEFTKVYSRRFGLVVVPEPTAVPLTAAARAAQGMDRAKTIAGQERTLTLSPHTLHGSREQRS
jgi:membrane protein